MAVALLATVMSVPLSAQAQEGDADRRARETEARMTDAERFSMLYSLMPIKFGTTTRDPRVPADTPPVGGYVRGVPRLGIPPLKEVDASVGVRWIGGINTGTIAFPADLFLGASFNPALAYDMGAVIGAEARARGFNAALGGGINIVRDVRNGRNFEYMSEDPLLSGLIGGEMVKGTQSQGVIATLKHISLNVTETNKFTLDAVIEEAAHREADLLAFEIAHEQGQPGAQRLCRHHSDAPRGGARA